MTLRTGSVSFHVPEDCWIHAAFLVEIFQKILLEFAGRVGYSVLLETVAVGFGVDYFCVDPFGVF